MTFTPLPMSATSAESCTDPVGRGPVLDTIHDATPAPNRGVSGPRQ
jgi:hypothetical protein